MERKNGAGPTHRRDHDQAHQEADQADGEQQQLAAVAPPHLLGVEVSHRGHQGLQAHKLLSTQRKEAFKHSDPGDKSVCVCV